MTYTGKDFNKTVHSKIELIAERIALGLTHLQLAFDRVYKDFFFIYTLDVPHTPYTMLNLWR